MKEQTVHIKPGKYPYLILNHEKRKRIELVMVRMHKIISPGEYGLGTEPGSYADNDKLAWEHLGKLYNQLERLLFPTQEIK